MFEKAIAVSARLGLGTVQFGLDYGITNESGQVGQTEVARILARAREAGIRTLDTAAGYGESERILGELVAADAPFDIVTKTIPLRRDHIGDEEITLLRAGFDNSLDRLRRPDVNALLVHNADDLLVPGGQRIYEQMLEWRDARLLKRIGVSVYDAGQIEAVFSRYDFDVVQLPVSVFDQRLIRNGMIELLSGKGVAIHARSVFLQGLALMEWRVLPAKLARFAPVLGIYRSFLEKNGISPMEAALGFVRHLPGIETTLVGVLSCKQLEECVAAHDAEKMLDLNEFAIDDHDLVDPRQWAAH